ncbi:hypothetical protein QSU92_01135 [Microbacterium sp. ET2]|uniref:hypothetical protein n=1 Tax=Microbacterium albipurpureum TaxID=3050384 RepID=UPI00259CE225|nr:hypothetical protein [Microbacterium sp. ET2 (Ac-2212)]WJL95860.1 hypothetical protein QSU92_01135 [Microbacterium sp. ET2 (Ac-2212)]
MSLSVSPVQSAKGRKARATYLHGADSPQAIEAGRDLAASLIEQYIEKVVASAPPLSEEQRDRLASLLRTAGPTPKVLRRPRSIDERIAAGGDAT